MEKNKVDSIFNNTIDVYKKYIIKEKGDVGYGYEHRIRQIEQIKNIFYGFDFDTINLVETGVSGNIDYGLSGLLLGGIVEQTNGKMYSVDLDYESCKNSRNIFGELYTKLDYRAVCSDSLVFLKNLSFIPNVVHLDSYEFDLMNPFPSALHTWKEFQIVEKIMPVGSIVIIDDNWIKNTNLQWVLPDRKITRIIDYPIIGKGSNIYNEVVNGNTDWELVGDHYKSHDNIKIVIKKVKQ